MTTSAVPPTTVAFVLASYRPDEPAGMERAVAAMASGLRKLGHHAVIITAAPQPRADPGVVTLSELPVAFPCDDGTLRDAIRSAGPALPREIEAALRQHHADVVVYVDALWGLGILACEVRHPARRVLAVHVVGHDADLRTALAAAHRVTAPSASVLAEARHRGYRADTWQAVPNPLLIDPGNASPGREQREHLRLHGPVRAVARLGAEKGVTGLLAAAPLVPGRRTEVVLAAAGFEAMPGSQADLLAECRALAQRSGAVLLPALTLKFIAADNVRRMAADAGESLSGAPPSGFRLVLTLVQDVLIPGRRSTRSRRAQVRGQPDPRPAGRTLTADLTAAARGPVYWQCQGVPPDGRGGAANLNWASSSSASGTPLRTAAVRKA